MSEEDNSSTSKKPVAEHFNLTGHSLEDGIFIGIELAMPAGES